MKRRSRAHPAQRRADRGAGRAGPEQASDRDGNPDQDGQPHRGSRRADVRWPERQRHLHGAAHHKHQRREYGGRSHP